MQAFYSRFKKVKDFSAVLKVLLCISIFFLSLPVNAENTRIDNWQQDIDQLVKELPGKHKNLYFNRSEKDFMNDIHVLKQSIPKMSDTEIVFSLSKIVASFGDAHTGLYFRPSFAFPMTLYWFKEGIYVINTIAGYEKILYCRLLEIDNKPVNEILTILSDAIPHENTAQLKKSIPYFMILSEFLHAAGIIQDPEKSMFCFEESNGDRFEMEMETMSMKGKFLPIVNVLEKDLPLYRRKSKQYYSFENLEKYNTIYVLYNSCQVMKEKPFSQFVGELFDAVNRNEVDRLVVDLRNNGGGNSSIIYPLISEIKNNEKLNNKDRLFVIIGRRTFSSAVLNAIQFKNQTNATFVGEPSGGRPNHFGEVKSFVLKNSKLMVSYSTKYFTHSQQDTDAFYPDITVELSINDYKNNVDPVLGWILGH